MEFLQTFIVTNIVTIVLGSIAECCNEKSIFKPATRRQNEKYWRKRVHQAIKAYVYSMLTSLMSSVMQAIWAGNYAEIYCTHPHFHFGRFLIGVIFYFILMDFLFYWEHRLLHVRSPIDVYKHIHLFHHRFNPVTSYAYQAGHPVEWGVLNSNHFIIGFMMFWIFPFDVHSHQLAGLLEMVWSIFTHDGTFLADHMTHHDTVTKNFGMGYLKFWDVLCNTYRGYGERKAGVMKATRIKLQ